MKNLRLAALALLAASTSTCSALAQDAPIAPAPAALQNSGFEGAFKSVVSHSDSSNATAKISGELAAGWSDNSDWAPVTLRYARDTSNPHRGESSQRIEIGRVEGGAVQFVQSVPVKKGRVYEARAWLRGQPGQSVSLSLRRSGAPYTEYASQSVALASEWNEVRVLAPATDDAEAFLMIRAASPQTFWVDDAALVDVTDAASNGAPIVGNQLFNGSFETARLPFGWSVRFEGGQDFRPRDPRPVLDSTTAAAGRQSLRVNIPPGGNAAITSPLVQPNYARPHVASVWLKASRPDTLVQLHLENTELYADVKVGPQWQRFTLSGTLPFRRWTQLRVSIPTQESAASVWMDGASLEEGLEKGAGSGVYSAAAPLEMTMDLDAVGHVVFDKQKAQVLVSVAGAVPAGARLARSVEELGGRVVPLPALALPSISFATGFELPAMDGRRGMWKMRAQVLAADGRALSSPVQMVWARLPRPKNIAPEKSYFGLHVPLAERYVRLGLAVGARWTRLHDTSMVGKWALAEPQPGDYKYFDEGINLTRRLGMQVLGMMDGAPRWASTRPREGYWGIWHIPDAPGALDSWERYCGRMAEHYRGRIDYWEVWNEPWGEWFLGAGGQPELYAELMARAHRALHKANPNATLLGLDTTAGFEEKWAIPVLAKSGTGSFEALSFHEYNDALFGGPASIPAQRARVLKALMEKYGQSKPLWNTEGGLFGVGSWYSPVTGGMAPAAQGAYMVRYDVAMMGAGVRKSFLYALHSDSPMGGFETRVTEVGDAIKPILGARAVLASLVDGAGTPRRDEPVRGVDRYTFPNRVQVLWSFDGQNHTLNVPPKMRALDLWGNATGADRAKIGIEPLYFVRR